MIEFQKCGDLGYYLTPEFAGEKANARWGGKARELLGLPEEFDPVMFERVLDGRNPHDGSKLTARLKDNRRQGWDATITDEKVSSVLELVAGDERVGKLRRDANDFAMKKLEKLVSARVRKGGANDDRVTGIALWATFEHETNRDGMPHKHHHNLLVNVTWDGKERAWKAVELDQREARKVERAHTKYIVDGLKELGYKVKWYGRRYDIPAIDRDVIGHYSTGSRRVKGTKEAFDANAEKLGRPKMSAKAAAKLSLYDRPPKVGNGSREAMRRDWAGKLGDDERAELNRAVGRSKTALAVREWHSELHRHAAALRDTARNEAPERAQYHGRGR